MESTKRVISALILFPIVAAILIFGNKQLVDVTVSIIALMALHEYFNSFKEEKGNKALRIIGYISVLIITFMHSIPKESTLKLIATIIPVSILVLFSQIIMSDMKYNIKDIAITFFGICYIVIFLMFIPVIREMPNGRILIWFVFIAAWGTDTFAYSVGRRIGKHKFTKISPKKSIEGCIAGILGAIISLLIYTLVCNIAFKTSFNYFVVILIGLVLSLVGQIGDLAASSIKRYTGIKDFGNLIPGHGGILDRIDSVIFIAPFAYFLLSLL